MAQHSVSSNGATTEKGVISTAKQAAVIKLPVVFHQGGKIHY